MVLKFLTRGLSITILAVLFSSPAFSDTLYGLHMDLTYSGDKTIITNAIEKAKEVNTQVSRNSFLWHKIEAQEGVKDWTIPDFVVDELLNSGIEPLFCIYGSPSWANGVSGSVENFYLYAPTDDQMFTQWVAKYKDFVSEAVTRYKGKVKKWELWNEENQHWFWKPVPNVDQYVLWYKEMYQAIRGIDPSIEVSLGGLSGLCCAEQQDYNGKTFLQELYNRNVYPDIISIHPYSHHAPDVHIQWQNNFDDIELIYNVMSSNGQQGNKIWITEWGWSTDKVSETTQSEYLDKSLEMINTMYPYVTIATYFLDYDRPPEYIHGLYTVDFRLKEAGFRFKEFIQRRIKPTPVKNLRIVTR